jgi:phosphoglycolate phosphatase-like HAD superfamily hydrolase
VLAFDLDSTLFDNRPRQARILREFGAARGLTPLGACLANHWDTGWDMKAAMRNCGLTPEQVEAHYDEARAFWMERFFTSDYCVEDVAIQGASAFTHAVVATGAQLAYVTGRPEEMRAGTLEAMRRSGMALPGEGRVLLIMKPSPKEHDDAFKREAHTRLGTLGQVIAAFDNEPTHVNDYKRKFPEATVVHLATDHSGRPVQLLEGVISIPHFVLAS